MSNVAREVIWPDSSDILIRVVFLYVGQGDSTIVLVKDGDTYQTILVDINRDKEGLGGINVPMLMKDLLAECDGKLDVLVNTHPHNDHVDDVTELSEEVDIQSVWHSGHKPGPKHQESYDELQKVIKKVRKAHGEDAIVELSGSRSPLVIGEAEYYVLAPAEHVKDDIGDEDPDVRHRRIHEQCAVLKFGKDESWVLLAGDADRDAFEKWITQYHKDRMPASVMNGPHHGSRTFFRYEEEDEPYKDALETIDPTYVVISAPKSNESPHGHPHDSAMELYEVHVGEDNVLHTGKNRTSYICDVYTDGEVVINEDSRLVEEYGRDDDNGDGESAKANASPARVASPAIVTGTRIDRRPMGSGS
jgi:beta-lactamase superfamily II metal-dependent hydrolase